MLQITKDEYYKLRLAYLKLAMLEAGGVDNWEGYEESLSYDCVYQKDFVTHSREWKIKIYGEEVAKGK